MAHIKINESEVPQMKMEHGFDIQGVPVGNPDARERIAQIYLDEILAYADKILSAQDASLLPQHCVRTKATQMLRYCAVPPHILRDFDSQLKLKVITGFGIDVRSLMIVGCCIFFLCDLSELHQMKMERWL